MTEPEQDTGEYQMVFNDDDDDDTGDDAGGGVAPVEVDVPPRGGQHA